MSWISWEDFESVDIRVGKIVDASEFPEARKPAYKLLIDLGEELGMKKSSAQITRHYALGDLVGKLVICVVNFPPRQIGPFRSEVLVTGFADDNKDVVLAVPDKPVPLGKKLF